jgi:hypothetical protein
VNRLEKGNEKREKRKEKILQEVQAELGPREKEVFDPVSV